MSGPDPTRTQNTNQQAYTHKYNVNELQMGNKVTKDYTFLFRKYDDAYELVQYFQKWRPRDEIEEFLKKDPMRVEKEKDKSISARNETTTSLTRIIKDLQDKMPPPLPEANQQAYTHKYNVNELQMGNKVTKDYTFLFGKYDNANELVQYFQKWRPRDEIEEFLKKDPMRVEKEKDKSISARNETTTSLTRIIKDLQDKMPPPLPVQLTKVVDNTTATGGTRSKSRKQRKSIKNRKTKHSKK